MLVSVKFLGGPLNNCVKKLDDYISIMESAQIQNRDQSILDLGLDGENNNDLVDNVVTYRTSGLKDDKYTYFIPDGTDWHDYKTLRKIYFKNHKDDKKTDDKTTVILIQPD